MKQFFSLLFFLPLFSVAQDCSLKKFKDQFSQEPKLSTGFMRFANGSLSVDADGKELDFLFSIPVSGGDAKCYDDNSTVSFVFEGSKSKLNFKNSGTMNCDGLFHITFKNLATTPSPLQKLFAKKITTISLTGSNKVPTTITLSPEQQDLVMSKISCIVTEAKTLSK